MSFFQTSFFLLLFLCTIDSFGFGNFWKGREEIRKNDITDQTIQGNKTNQNINHWKKKQKESQRSWLEEILNLKNGKRESVHKKDGFKKENDGSKRGGEKKKNENDGKMGGNGGKNERNKNQKDGNVGQKNDENVGQKNDGVKNISDGEGVKKHHDGEQNGAPQKKNGAPPKKNGSHEEVAAVCVVGELRHFEKTVAGIFQYFVRYLAHHFKRVDIFFSSFLNPESFKIFLAIRELEFLKKSLPPQSEVRLLTIQMPFQYPYQSSPYRNVALPFSLTGADGIFGLFNLTLGCNEAILEQERKEGFEYDRIFKTRVDSLWFDFPKNLSLSENCLFLPQYFNFTGYNDRFLMGPRDAMILTNNRFETLRKHQTQNKRSGNSENSLKREIWKSHLCVKFINELPFCLYRSISKYAEGLITQLPSHHPISNGGPCRECLSKCANISTPERQSLFIQQVGVGAAKPIFLLEETLEKIFSIDDCEKILSLEIRDFWKSDATLKDACIFGRSEIEVQQKRQEKLKPEFEESLDFLKSQVSSSANRALRAWDKFSVCSRFPISCTQKEKLQIEAKKKTIDSHNRQKIKKRHKIIRKKLKKEEKKK